MHGTGHGRPSPALPPLAGSGHPEDCELGKREGPGTPPPRGLSHEGSDPSAYGARPAEVHAVRDRADHDRAEQRYPDTARPPYDHLRRWARKRASGRPTTTSPRWVTMGR